MSAIVLTPASAMGFGEPDALPLLPISKMVFGEEEREPEPSIVTMLKHGVKAIGAIYSH